MVPVVPDKHQHQALQVMVVSVLKFPFQVLLLIMLAVVVEELEMQEIQLLEQVLQELVV